LGVNSFTTSFDGFGRNIRNQTGRSIGAIGKDHYILFSGFDNASILGHRRRL
jgi:hypothetical protein